MFVQRTLFWQRKNNMKLFAVRIFYRTENRITNNYFQKLVNEKNICFSKNLIRIAKVE